MICRGSKLIGMGTSEAQFALSFYLSEFMRLSFRAGLLISAALTSNEFLLSVNPVFGMQFPLHWTCS